MYSVDANFRLDDVVEEARAAEIVSVLFAEYTQPQHLLLGEEGEDTQYLQVEAGVVEYDGKGGQLPAPSEEDLEAALEGLPERITLLDYTKRQHVRAPSGGSVNGALQPPTADTAQQAMKEMFAIMHQHDPMSLLDLHNWAWGKASKQADVVALRKKVGKREKKLQAMSKDIIEHLREWERHEYHDPAEANEEKMRVITDLLQARRVFAASIQTMINQQLALTDKLIYELIEQSGDLQLQYFNGTGELYDHAQMCFLMQKTRTLPTATPLLFEQAPTVPGHPLPTVPDVAQLSSAPTRIGVTSELLEDITIRKQTQFVDQTITTIDVDTPYQWGKTELAEDLAPVIADLPEDTRIYIANLFGTKLDNADIYSYDNHYDMRKIEIIGDEDPLQAVLAKIASLDGVEDSHLTAIEGLFTQYKTKFKPVNTVSLHRLHEQDGIVLQAHTSDDAIVERLGALTARERDVPLPSVSWGRPLRAGIEYHGNVGDTTVNYVPHDRPTEDLEYITATVSFDKKRLAAETESFMRWNASTEAPAMYTLTNTDGEQTTVFASDLHSLKSLENDLSSRGHSLHLYSCREEIEALAGSEGYVSIRWDQQYCRVEKSTPEDLLAAGWIQTDAGWTSEQKLEQCKQAVADIHALPDEVDLRIAVGDVDIDDDENYALYVMADQYLKEHVSQHYFGEEVDEYSASNVQHIVETVPVPTIASDRGKLEVTAPSIEAAMAALADCRIIDNTDITAPASVYAPAYHQPHQATVLPVNKMLIHGMTSVQWSDKGATASNTIANILLTGGLQSIAQRRAYGVSQSTTSPGGDVASGLDMAVPFTVAESQFLGGDVVFVAKPSVLERKHVFFSPIDFGGGHNRMEDFDKHAQLLGQQDAFDPPSLAARQNHLLHFTGGRNNEVWVRDGITVDEMAAWLIEEDVYDSVVATVDQLRDQVHVPPGLQLIKYKERGDISDIIADLWRQYHQPLFGQ